MVLSGRKKPKVHPLVRMVSQWSLGCPPTKKTACLVHVASVPFTESGALFKNLLKELCWDSAGAATLDSMTMILVQEDSNTKSCQSH